MKEIDRYHKWVEWDDEDGVYIGKCPDLITGIHGGDPACSIRSSAKSSKTSSAISSRRSVPCRRLEFGRCRRLLDE